LLAQVSMNEKSGKWPISSQKSVCTSTDSRIWECGQYVSSRRRPQYSSTTSRSAMS
jgi:hypothetical protein